MKIQIDTAVDSKADIQKVIKLLAGIAGAQHAYEDHTPELPSQSVVQPEVSSFMNMFDAPVPKQEPLFTAPTPRHEEDAIIPQVEFY